MVAPSAALGRDEVQAILSLYHLEGLEDFGGLSPDSGAYWVTACGRSFLLRLSPRRSFRDMVFERDVLAHLRKHDLPVPALIPNVAQGSFTPWSRKGRYVSLFEHLPGRALGVFEIRARHTQRVGQVYAAMHRAMAGFARHRAHPFGRSSAHQLHERLQRAAQGRRLARRHQPAVTMVGEALKALAPFDAQTQPGGVVHGAPEVQSLRFADHRVVGLLNLDRSGTHRWTWDLAGAVSAWCWTAAVTQGGGPQGEFDEGRTRALLRAYHRMRPLSRCEQALLPDELRLVAAHEALLRMAAHELGRGQRASRYKDYRHHTARLEALSEGRAEALVQDALR